MDVEAIRDFCLQLKGTTEEFPFDDTTLTFKVMGKVYVLLSLNHPQWMNLKCDPDRALELREEYEYIRPGYHMNKKHWNTLDLEMHPHTELTQDLIRHSYELVVAKLPKALREALYQ